MRCARSNHAWKASPTMTPLPRRSLLAGAAALAAPRIAVAQRDRVLKFIHNPISASSIRSGRRPMSLATTGCLSSIRSTAPTAISRRRRRWCRAIAWKMTASFGLWCCATSFAGTTVNPCWRGTAWLASAAGRSATVSGRPCLRSPMSFPRLMTKPSASGSGVPSLCCLMRWARRVRTSQR